MGSNTGRVAAGIAALVAWAAVLWLLHDQIGFTHASILAAIWDDAGYMTDLGNLLTAVVFTGAALGRRWASPWLIAQATVVILLVGIGSWTVGREYLVFGTRGIGDMLAHGLSPVVATIVWIVFAPKQGLRWIDAVRWLGVPVAYLAYAITRGMVTGHFAYGWLDPRPQGWTPVLFIMSIFVVMIVLIGAALIVIARISTRKTRREP